MMQTLPHLVGERTVSVDFTSMFTFCPSEKMKISFIQVCELLAQAAPNIEELSMASEYPKLIIQDLLQPLTIMQKLQILQLRFCEFDRDGLIELCKALPSLRVLSVGCFYYDIEYSGCGNNLSRALQHLKVLEDDSSKRIVRISYLSFFTHYALEPFNYKSSCQITGAVLREIGLRFF